MGQDYLNNPSALKIDLMLRGLRIDEGVDIGSLVEGEKSVDILLPKETIVNVPFGDEFIKNSPYILMNGPDGHVISDGTGDVPCEVVPVPDFYMAKNNAGVPFSRMATSHGSYVAITPRTNCEFFDEAVECKYCAGEFDTHLAAQGADFSIDEVLECVEAIKRDKLAEIIYLSMGFTSGDDGGIEFLAPYIQAIKKHFNFLVAVEALPPKKNKWIDDTYAVGADSVLYNLEIFDKGLFEVICPGRSELIGRKRYFNALEYAVQVFPSGTVASHLIVGLEPPGSTIKGIDFLTELGVVPILPIYRPRPGKALRIEPLTTEIIVPVYKHLYKAVKEHSINMNWVRDISLISTPIEGRYLVEDNSGISLFDSFYKSRFGRKTALGLSTLRRKLRVRSHKDYDDFEADPSSDASSDDEASER